MHADYCNIKIFLHSMKIKKAFGLALVALIVASCKTPTDVVYFQDLKGGQVDEIKYSEGIRLKPQDKISILVKSRNHDVSNLLNLAVANQYIGYNETQVNNSSRGVAGYTLDKDGNIDFPVYGKMHIAGMTREEVVEYVKTVLAEKNIARDLVVTVDFLNLHYNVLGEVARPGEFAFGQDRVSLPEAISKAGDLTINGVRDSVFVYRTNGGNRETIVVNMLDGASLVNSPAYYLQQNDVVYVRPNEFKQRQSKVNGNTFQTTTFWLSFTSVMTTIAMLLFR